MSRLRHAWRFPRIILYHIRGRAGSLLASDNADTSQRHWSSISTNRWRYASSETDSDTGVGSFPAYLVDVGTHRQVRCRHFSCNDCHGDRTSDRTPTEPANDGEKRKSRLAIATKGSLNAGPVAFMENRLELATLSQAHIFSYLCLKNRRSELVPCI